MTFYPDMPLTQKWDKLSEDQQRLMWRFFRMGNQARQVAIEMELNRKTVDRYFGRWRKALAKGATASAAAAPLAGVVECDESYFGGDPRKASYDPPKEGQKRGRGALGKVKVFGMVERPGDDGRPGRVVPVVVEDVKSRTLIPLLEAHVDKAADLMTDDFKSYKPLEKHGFNHYPVNHAAGEWKEAWTGAHTNTIESFWNHAKRHLKKFNGGWRPKPAVWLGECAARWMWREPKALLAAMKRGLGMLRAEKV